MFDHRICESIKYYVYRLVDPRNGETFYVGKGSGNRVFEHAKGAVNTVDDRQSLKIKRINKIIRDGHEVICLIHRHGMDEDTAFHVEAALIDAYSGLLNIQDGHYNDSLGVRSADLIIKQYAAKDADLSDHSYLAITINKCFDEAESSVYDCVRYAWRLNPDRAKKVDYVLAVSFGLIVGVYVVDEWMAATPENFPYTELLEGRWGFIGNEAPAEVLEKLLDKKVPNSFRKKGVANPVQYINDE